MRTSLSLLTLFAVVASSPALAVESRAEQRKLAGHPYLPSALFVQPFDTRHYAMSTGVGFAQFEVPGFADELALGYFGLETNVQQPVWGGLGLRFDFGGTVISGAEENAALTFGANGSWTVGGGLYYNFLRLERFAMTAALDLSGGEGYTISPGRALQIAVDTGRLRTSSLFFQTTSFELRPSVSLAFGLFEAMGLYGEVAFAHDESTQDDDESTTDTLLFAVGLSTNLAPYSVPLGLNVAYQRSTVVAGDKQEQDFIELALYYAPNINFAFGPAVGLQFAELDNDVKLSNYVAQIGMVYYQ